LRDTDPAIRTDCVRELGVWVRKYPQKYATNTYLNYFVRESNDPDGSARLETVKALSGLFSNASLANNASSFTLRLAPRLIKMASLDVETPVRTHAIRTITLIDKTGALQDEMEEDREKVARLIFDREPRVRKAAAGFVQNLWEERAEHLQAEWKSLRAGKKKRAANVKEDELDVRLRWKALGALLVQTAHGLTDQPDEDPSSSQADLTSVPDTDAITRAEAAADGLWTELSEQQEELADYLLLDHSTHEQDMWLLTEEEEDFMLGMLIACIKKMDEEDDENTKSLMGILPRLFTKHQSEPSRIAGILSIPEHMNLQLYLDMRKGPAYEALWSDVTSQFLKHTDANVLQAATRAINKLVDNSTMESTNTPKLAELEEAVFASLRDSVNGEDVFSMQLDDDAAVEVEAVLMRVSLLGRSRDISWAMLDEEGGQSSGWAIISEFAKRGGLGFKHESKVSPHTHNFN
jgi:cohesin complex subunit SA-1/2